MNLLSIDYGTRKSGLAYSVESFVFGYKTVPTPELWGHIERLIREKHIGGIVIGMPYNVDGTRSRHSQRVEAYARILETKTPLPIILHDERLTSSEARITFDDFGVDGDIDTESARLILESYIETQVNI